MFWIVRILTQIDPSDDNVNRNSNLNTKDYCVIVFLFSNIIWVTTEKGVSM